MRCSIAVGIGESIEGEMLGVQDGRVTVLVDGYEASDTFPLGSLVSAWREDP